MKRRAIILSAAAIAAATLPLSATSQEVKWPTKPVRLVVAYPPGGSTDTQARLVAKKLSDRWGQPVIVDNKPGGNTVIATTMVAKADPDGHTLLLTALPVALNPLLMEKLPYDAATELAPVALLTTIPNILVVHPGYGVKNVQELIAKIRSSPEATPYASAGQVTSTHLSAAMFASSAKLKMTHIPYKGSASAHQDLLSGRVPIMFDNGAMQHVKAGKLLALGVTSAKRVPWLPDVPTVAEQGLPGYEAVAWYGIFATGGTSKAVVDRIAADVTWAIRSPDIAPMLEGMGANAEGGTPDQFRRYVASEAQRWGQLIREQNIKLD